MPRPVKNVAFAVGVSLYKNDGTLVANPGTVTAKISKDWGDYADVGTVSEEDTTYGQLRLSLTATEMNADVVSLYVTDNTSGTVPWTATIYTVPATEAADVVSISGDTAAADNLEAYCDGTTPQPVNMTQLGGTAQSATDLKDFADTGYDPSTHKVAEVVTIPAVTLAATQGSYAPAKAGDAMTCADATAAKDDLANATDGLGALKTAIETRSTFDSTTDEVTPTTASKTGYALVTAPPTTSEIRTEIESVGGMLAQVANDTGVTIPLAFGSIAGSMALDATVAKEVTVSALNDFDPATDVVAHVTLVDTVTTVSEDIAADVDLSSVTDAIAAVDTKIDTIDNNVDTVVTAVVADIPATLAVIDGNVDDIETTVDTEVPAILVASTAAKDILEADVEVNTADKTITYKHKDTGTTLLEKDYDDSGSTQGVS